MSNEYELPQAPSARRLIVALNVVDYDRLDLEDSRSLTSRADVTIVNADTAAQHGEGLVARLSDRGLLRPGRILVQSPFQVDEYADAEQAPDAFAMDKVTRMSTLASLLGAKSLQLTSVSEENTNTRWEANADAQRVGIKLGAKGDRTAAAAFARKVRFEDTFAGSEPNIEGAYEHLRSCNLDGDRELLSLIEARSVVNNSHAKRVFSVDLSTESDIRLNLAAEVSALPFLKGKATFVSTSKSRAHYRVEYTITY